MVALVDFGLLILFFGALGDADAVVSLGVEGATISASRLDGVVQNAVYFVGMASGWSMSCPVLGWSRSCRTGRFRSSPLDIGALTASAEIRPASGLTIVTGGGGLVYSNSMGHCSKDANVGESWSDSPGRPCGEFHDGCSNWNDNGNGFTGGCGGFGSNGGSGLEEYARADL